VVPNTPTDATAAPEEPATKAAAEFVETASTIRGHAKMKARETRTFEIELSGKIIYPCR